jgi:CBS domain-containing protein
MQVCGAMTRTVVTANPQTTFHELVDLLIRHGVSGLPIVDATNHPIGIVTEADLVAKAAFGTTQHRVLELLTGRTPVLPGRWEAKAEALTADALMTSPVQTVQSTDPVSTAAARMAATGLKRLPVVDDTGRLIGIISRSDVLRLFHRTDAQLMRDVTRFVRDPVLGLGEAGLAATVHDGIVTVTGIGWAQGGARVAAALRHHVPGVVDVVVEAPPSTAGTAPMESSRPSPYASPTDTSERRRDR